jgi:hypothetical protein
MRRAEQERAKLDRLTAKCQVCQQPITPGQTWKYTETGGKVHYHCAEKNPQKQTKAGLVLGEHIHMPGVPQLIVTRAFAWQWWVGHGWPGPKHGIGSLDHRVYLPAPVDDPLTDVETRDQTMESVARSLAEQNPAGPTFSEAMTMARQAGARIGDTSGFDPWLVKAKLQTRSPLVRSRLQEQFDSGVEQGEVPQAKPTSTYKGVTIFHSGEGFSTSLDPGSIHDTLKDAKRFIDAQNNPATPWWKRSNPRLEVTDRAFRYRANATPPPGPKLCAFCGTNRKLQVGHVDGHEENNEPENKIWTCRSCNMLHANTLRAAGIGRLTRQYNPAARGAETYRQYALALMSMKGESDAMTVPAAIEMVHATSADQRSRFSREIWRLRRRHYGSTGMYRRSA